jgi:hypothetical protein
LKLATWNFTWLYKANATRNKFRQKLSTVY